MHVLSPMNDGYFPINKGTDIQADTKDKINCRL